MTTGCDLPAWPSDLSDTQRFQVEPATVADPALAVRTGPVAVQRRIALGRFRVVAATSGSTTRRRSPRRIPTCRCRSPR